MNRKAAGLVAAIVPTLAVALAASATGALSAEAGNAAPSPGRMSEVREAIDAPPPDPERLRDALREAYRGIDRETGFWARLRSNIVEALAAMARRIGAFLEDLGRFSGAATLIAWALVVGVALAVLMLLRRLGLVQERSERRRAEKRPETDWHRIAEDAIARGDTKGAVRALYASLLATLNRRGVLRDAPSLTAGECRTAVSDARPTLYPAVERATVIFEQVTYGHAPFGAGEIDTMREAERAARVA